MNRVMFDLTGGYPVQQSRWKYVRDVLVVLLAVICVAFAGGIGSPG